MTQQPYQPTYAQPKKKRRGLLIAVGLVIALCLVGGIAAAALSSSGGDTTGPGASNAADSVAKAGTKTIVMEITGPKKADVTYQLNADQSQANGAKLPWKKTMTSKEALTIAVLTAQNAGSGKITCTISVGGKVVKTNTSEGQYSVVTCEAHNF
jgi:flagellar basal body-associated protein FliL